MVLPVKSRVPGASNNSIKKANCQGQATCGAMAWPPRVLSKELSPAAKAAAQESGSGIAHDQDVLNKLVDKYNSFAQLGFNPANPNALDGMLREYDRIQSGKSGSGWLDHPMTDKEKYIAFLKQFGKTAAWEAGGMAAGGAVGKVVGGGMKLLGAGSEAAGAAGGAEGGGVGGAAGGAEGGGAGAGAAGGGAAAGEPVAVTTGEYIETWQDFLIPADLPFDGARWMGLQMRQPAGYVSPFGPCQTSVFDEVFVNPEFRQLDFHRADGKVIRFDRPFNLLPSFNAGDPHLELRAPWLKQLALKDRNLIKHFRQYDDRIYRLEKVEDLNGNIISFHRTAAGVLEKAHGTNGLALAFDNDAAGQRTCITLIGSDGSQLVLARYSYGAEGHMVIADCAFGMSVRYDWDAERNLILRWRNRTGRSETHFSYDAAGRVVHTRTNGIWNGDRFVYDPVARATTYLPSGDESLAQRFVYDGYNNVTDEFDALGHVTTRTFDAARFETSVRDANGATSQKAYDIRGNVRQHTDAEGRTTVYAWGMHGKLDMVIDGAGKIRRWTNDGRGNTVAETDAEGHEIRFIRDQRGRLLRAIFPDGAEESRTYDSLGRTASQTDARGGTTRFAYDHFGRVVETRDALGHLTRIEYGAGAGGFATPSAIVRADGVRIQRSFTSDGVLATVADGEGRTWRYSYGAFDVLQAIEEPGGGKLSFARDGEGRVTAVTNQVGACYRLIRDAAGRVIGEEDFDGRRTEYTRDPGGRVVETRKPDGMRLVYGYDRTDKLTSIKSFAAYEADKTRPLDETYFWYDRRGLLIKASNLVALVEFERDGNGRVTRETINGRTVESQRDARGNRVERRIGREQAGEGLVSILRDPLGMVASIAIDDHSPLDFTRDALGRETRRAFGSGFRLEQNFDALGRLVGQTSGLGAVERRYTFDSTGAPTSIADSIWGETQYAYDANGQVASAEFGDGFSEQFAYDPAKNIVGVKLQGPKIEPDFGVLLSWHATPGGVVQLARGPDGATIALTHDACGRIVERRIDRKGFRPKIWRYFWDAHDRLMRCDNPDNQTWFYRYDPFGRRLTKVRKLSDAELAWTAQRHTAHVPTEARDATKIWVWATPPNGAAADDRRPPIVGTHFMWDADLVAEEAPLRLDGTVDWDQAVRWHYQPESFRLLAKQAADQLLPIVVDHLGTPREMCAANGSLRWAVGFTTWGSIRGVHAPLDVIRDDRRAIFTRSNTARDMPDNGNRQTAALECPIRFLGQYEDEENGLYYNRHRYIDPIVGQYCSPDPLALGGGFRPHGYVENPTAWVDPLGFSSSFAMGLEEGLDSFASKVGAKTYKDFPKEYWKDIVIRRLNDPKAKNYFNLDGVNVDQGLSRASMGKGGATDWELLQIYQNPSANVQFYQGGVPVPRPF